MELRIPPEVCDHLGFYVYLYVDPRNRKPFYVGKGQGTRILAHLSSKGESRKAVVLAELRSLDLQPRLEILSHALPSEEAALRLEAAVIDLFGLDDLSNLVSGWQSIRFGRMPLSDLVMYYAAKPVAVTDPCILIRINRLYRHGMSPEELYEATRGRWKVGSRRIQAKLAFAVFEGVVREVYRIESWHPAGSTPQIVRVHDDPSPQGRWEFTGKPAEPEDRERYYGHSVASYFKPGMQSPTVYVNC